MFSISFWELCLVMLVALLVIGPDRLPDTLRTIFKTISTVRHAIDSTKATVNRQLALDTLRAEMNDIDTKRQEVVNSLSPDLQQYLKQLHEQSQPNDSLPATAPSRQPE